MRVLLAVNCVKGLEVSPVGSSDYGLEIFVREEPANRKSVIRTPYPHQIMVLERLASFGVSTLSEKRRPICSNDCE